MSHFYRFRWVNGWAGKAVATWKDAYRPSGVKESLPPELWWASEEILLSPPWPRCKMLRFPPYPPGFEQDFNIFRLRRGADFPDLISTPERVLVSERVKAVIEAADGFGHEFIETEIQDARHQRINRETFYLLSVRRFLEIDFLDIRLGSWKETFMPSSTYEERILATLQATPELMDKAAALPLWRTFVTKDTAYMSQVMLDTLRAAGLTGLKDYSHACGEPGESIARFEV